MYIALLRGINVNGHRMIRMADLRSLASGLGFEDVETYIQTGNVLLRSDGTEETVRSALEEALRGWFREEVPVAVRTPEQLRDVAATCPFAPQRDTVVYVGFFVRPPDPSRAADLAQRLPRTGDEMQLGERHVYIHYRQGVHRSPLSNAFFERALGVDITSRNLRTVQALAAPARRLPQAADPDRGRL